MALALSLIFVFVVGACVGSFLNVVIARLPYEKSLLWPNSRCGACQQPIRWYDNLPMISYLWLRGKCRTCGESFSVIYMLIELGTALGFVALFWLEVVEDVHRWPGRVPFQVALGIYPWTSWIGFAWHAVLCSFLLAASVCDLKKSEIPLSLTFTGTLVGLAGSVLMPWPFPHTLSSAVPPPVIGSAELGWQAPNNGLLHGVYAWPFWGPLPEWAAPGDNWQTGLATGVLGALAGTFLLRIIGFVFSKGLGREGLGLGDADLMMMAGSFLGWQMVVVAFFLSPLFGLIFSIIRRVVYKDSASPFGPFLSMSVMATCLAWWSIGEVVRPFIFWGEILVWAAIGCVTALYVMSFMLRIIQGTAEEAK